MNIVVFGNASGFGGAQTAFRRLVDHFVADGHSVGVIGLVTANDNLPGAGKSVFESRIENQNSSQFRKLAQTCQAGWRARSHRPDFFISVGLANTSSLIARMLPRSAFCVTQDFIYGRSPHDPLLISSMHGFDALAVQSPSMISSIRSQGYAATSLNWLPCFPDPPLPGYCRAERSGRSEIRLAYFGRLAPNKGLDLLLHALAGSQTSMPVALDIWGGGSELEKLKAIADSDALRRRVAFHGRYPEGADYARLICSYDGLVLPSTGLEGLPLILLESMAYGVPFLTTRVCAIPDCCVDNKDVVLVEPTLEALRAGLEEFVSLEAAQSFSTERLVGYFQANYGSEALANHWRRMIANPNLFFSTHA